MLTPRQVEEKRVVATFLNAFNRGDFRRALVQFTVDPRFLPSVGSGDCDYRRESYVRLVGRAAVAKWLRERIRDHDRLTMRRLTLIGSRGAKVEYSRRASNTLAALGFRDGITTGLTTKVGFTTAGRPRITRFANAGGTACTPQ